MYGDGKKVITGDGTIRMIYNGAVQSGNTCLGTTANKENVEMKEQLCAK